jgi:parvulin-like peptidyl-prolyl isomerase
MIQIEKQHIFQQFFYRGVNEKEAVWWWKETKETNVKDGRVV